jgi:hypothetical protein
MGGGKTVQRMTGQSLLPHRFARSEGIGIPDSPQNRRGIVA